MITFIITLVILLVATGLLIFYYKHIVQRSLGSCITRRNSLREQINKISPNIQTATENFSAMSSLAEFTSIQTDITKLAKTLNETYESSKDLQNDLTVKQREVEKKELRQTHIKAKRDECIEKASEITGTKDELEAEFLRLQTELEQSRSQMSSLSDEVELKQEQKKAVEEISSVLSSSCQQMEDLKEEYSKSCDRFLSLEHQYQELEAEYARLVEKELSKNPWMKAAE